LGHDSHYYNALGFLLLVLGVGVYSASIYFPAWLAISLGILSVLFLVFLHVVSSDNYARWLESSPAEQVTQPRPVELAAGATLDSTSKFSTHPAPEPLPYGVSPKGAEQLVADWMRHLGMRSAEATRYTRDSGIDVT
jgi:hypothetical protein